MKTAALLALALAGSLQADPIWSYQFADHGIGDSFIIWHDGPIVPGGIGDRALFTGDQLHGCVALQRLICESILFTVIGNDLSVLFDRQRFDDPNDRIMTPEEYIFINVNIGVPGTYTATYGGNATLKISDDPADLAPEPTTLALLSFGMIGLCASRHRSLVVRRKAKPIAYSPRPSS